MGRDVKRMVGMRSSSRDRARDAAASQGISDFFAPLRAEAAASQAPAQRPASAPSRPSKAAPRPAQNQQALAARQQSSIKASNDNYVKKTQKTEANIAAGMERNRRRRSSGFGETKLLYSSAQPLQPGLNNRLG